MVTRHVQSLEQAIAHCADEPIHIPGSIQSHGFLLVLGEPQLEVIQASENVQQWLGKPAEALLGQRLETLFPGLELAPRLQALSDDDNRQQRTFQLESAMHNNRDRKSVV